MTATAFLLVDPNNKVRGVRASEAAAESVAERIGSRVVAKAIESGDRVSFTWQGWPKHGTVMRASGSKVEVRFPLKSGVVVKAVSVDKLTFARP